MEYKERALTVLKIISIIIINIIILIIILSCTSQQRWRWKCGRRREQRLEQAVIDRPSAGSCLIPACSELISSTARWATQMVAEATAIALSHSHLLPTRRRRRQGMGEGRGGGWVRGRQRSSQSHSHRAKEPVGWWAGLPVLYQLGKQTPGFIDDGESFRTWITGGMMGPLELFFSLQGS